MLTVDDEKHALAGELALGLLEGEERANALRDLQTDPEMRAAYRAWNARLAPIYASADMPDAKPSAHVLENIEEMLFGPSDAPLLARFLDFLRSPENRGIVVATALAKAALIGWIIYLFL